MHRGNRREFWSLLTSITSVVAGEHIAIVQVNRVMAWFYVFVLNVAIFGRSLDNSVYKYLAYEKRDVRILYKLFIAVIKETMNEHDCLTTF